MSLKASFNPSVHLSSRVEFFRDVILTGNGSAAGLVGHVWSFDCVSSRYACNPSSGLYLTADREYWQTG